MLGFDPEPSLTIVVFWAERLFRTHPPSKAAAPPERGTRQNEFPLGHFTGAPSEKLPRPADHCRTNSRRVTLRETLREAAWARGTRQNQFFLGHFTGAPSEKLPRNAEHCRTNSPRVILRETLREAAPERGTRHNSKESEFLIDPRGAHRGTRNGGLDMGPPLPLNKFSPKVKSLSIVKS